MATLKNQDHRGILESFKQDCRLKGLTEDSILDYETNLKIFLNWLNRNHADTHFTQLDQQHEARQVLKDFLTHLDQRDLAYSTKASYFSALSSLTKHLVFEGEMDRNLVKPFRERYLAPQQSKESQQERQLISVKEMGILVNSILDRRGKAITTLLAKTGVRRGELVAIDQNDIDWEEYSVELKARAKRSNTTVFFDDETARTLKAWLTTRQDYARDDRETDALFLGERGDRLQGNGLYITFTKHAERIGLHDPDSDDLKDKFTPHCCRHWFTTHLRRSGMKREFIKELRGDTRGDAIDIYDHIDRKELRESYLAHVPTLGL